MTRRRKLATAVGTTLLVAASFSLGSPQTVTAADHTDSASVEENGEVDIADFFLWHRGMDDEQTVVLAMTFAGLTPMGGDATYDRDILYGIHIDQDQDGTADVDIWARFGMNCDGEWGVQFEGIPGVDGALQGLADTNLDGGNGSMAYAGLRDDPFFFDFEGFEQTLTLALDDMDDNDPMNGVDDIGFRVIGDPTMAPYDSFATTNVMAIVVELPRADAAGDNTAISAWATTHRFTEE